MSSENVSSTNNDASRCKRFAVSQGYWKDPYIEAFVRSLPPRKAPEINRGYFMRQHVINSLISKFLTETACACQIINLGAGFDTLYWNLRDKNMLPKNGLYEVDLPQIVAKKRKIILASERLKIDSSLAKQTGHSLSAGGYHLIAADICNVEALKSRLFDCGCRTNTPTLVLAECVFMYIEKQSVQSVLCFFTDQFPTVMLVDYDPVRLDDRFGETMRRNLEQRGCSLLGVHNDLELKRDAHAMFENFSVRLLSDVYKNLPVEEKRRIEKLEFFDEIELLEDLLKHYCVSWSYNAPGDLFAKISL